MRGSTLHVVLVIQILLQALMGAVPGTVLCIPLGECCAHEARDERSSACSSDGGCDAHAVPCGSKAPAEPSPDDRTPTPFGLAAPAHCGCHFHLPLPGDPKLSAPRVGATRDGGAFDLAPVAPSIAATCVDDGGRAPPWFDAEPPDPSRSDRMLGLRSTHLRR